MHSARHLFGALHSPTWDCEIDLCASKAVHCNKKKTQVTVVPILKFLFCNLFQNIEKVMEPVVDQMGAVPSKFKNLFVGPRLLNL